MEYCRDVFNALSLMTEISESESDTAMLICELSLKEILARIRSDVDVFDPRVNSAAAAQAFYRLCIKRLSLEETAGLSSFQAGDLKVSYEQSNPRSQFETSKEILAQAMEELAPLLVDTGFFVGKVDI